MTTTVTTKDPILTLNNGVAMPAFGLGVYQSGPDETVEAVKIAITEGYGLIDTAAAYFKEQQVGEGIRQSRVDRKQIFVTTKLWMPRSCVVGHSDAVSDRSELGFDADPVVP